MGHACKSLCVCIHVYLFLVPSCGLMRAQYTFPGFEHEAMDFGINSKLHKTTHISMNQLVTSSTAGEVSHRAWKCMKGISIVTQPSSHFWTMAIPRRDLFTVPQTETSRIQNMSNYSCRSEDFVHCHYIPISNLGFISPTLTSLSSSEEAKYKTRHRVVIIAK